VHARLTVDGVDSDVEALWDWLRNEQELRGRVRVGSAPAAPGTMGVPVEVVVTLGTATTTAATVLARSLSTWLKQRHSDVTVTVTGPDGRRAEVSVRRARDAEHVLRTVLASPRTDLSGEQ
jgi:hypothetical protein